MQKLQPEQIIRTEIVALTDADRLELTRKKDNQLLIISAAWVVITGLCFYCWKTGSDSMNLDNKSFRVHFTLDNTETLRRTVPYICAFAFLVATFFLVKFLVRSIIPLGRDIKNGRKSLLYYKPVKSSDISTRRYYLSTPFNKNYQLEISREDFDAIIEEEELCLEIAPNSYHLLRLSKDQKAISYY